MAGLGRRTFAAGEVLTASNVMGYLQDQAVMNFAGTAARGSAIGSAVSEGMVSYLQDTNSVEVYKTAGTAIAGWEPVNLAQSPNVVINGAFEINQRSFTSTAATNAYTYDRWITENSLTAGTATYSAQAFTAGAAPVAGYEGKNYARVLTSGVSGNGYALYGQKVEDVRTFAGETVTISFWAKAASGTPQVAPYFQQNFGTGGSSSVTIKPANITLSTSWARYSVTTAIPSISGKTLGANSFLFPYFLVVDNNILGSGIGAQNNTFDFWGVQVEAGSTATPFRRNANSVQGELAACQRYYVRFGGSAAYETLAQGAFLNSSIAIVATKSPVTMRTVPSSVEFSNILVRSYDADFTVTGGGADNAGKDYLQAYFNISGTGTQYRPVFIRTNNSLAAYIGWSAEL